jgi:hypothetical protein
MSTPTNALLLQQEGRLQLALFPFGFVQHSSAVLTETMKIIIVGAGVSGLATYL